MCIAEAPGKEEDRTGTPLVGQSGKLLRSSISEIIGNYVRDGLLPVTAFKDVWLTNVNRCRPPENRKPTKQEIHECLPWLQMEIDEVQPKCILALGRTSQEALVDLDIPEGCEIIVAYHPAFILRQRKKLDAWKEVLDHAVRCAFSIDRADDGTNRGDILDYPVDYIQNVTQFELSDPDLNAKYLAADTEFDDLEEHVGVIPVGYSLSDGKKAIFKTDTPPKLKHVYVHRADADLETLAVDPDDFSQWDDTILMAFPLQQKYGWPFLGLKRPDGQGLAQIVPSPPVVWRRMLKGDLLRIWQPSNAVFKTGPRKGQEKPGKWKKNVKFSEAYNADPKEAGDYGATDAFGTSRLAESLDSLLEENPWARDYYERIEKPLMPVLLQMERTGIQIDQAALYSAGEVIDAERLETELKLHLVPQFADINIGSTQQLGPILLDMGLVDGKLTETGKIAVSETNILHAFGVEVDSELPDTEEGRIAATILKWREMGKLRSVYVNGISNRLDPEGRVHPRFNSTGAYTNRLSSSDPNAQNVPSRSEIGMAIRRAFIARNGCVLVGGDCSQIQLRAFGEMTNAPIFIEAYCDASDRGCLPLCKCSICDVHQRFTDLVNSMGYHVERSSHTGGPSMKNGVFGVLYGVEAKKLALTIGIPEDDAGKFMTEMKRRAPEVIEWPKIAAAELSSKGYVETLLGWRMYFPDFGGPVNKWHKEAIRAAACGKVQGTEAGLVKACMIDVYNILRKEFPEVKMNLAVHDEVWAECPEDQAKEVEAMIKEVFETTPKKWMKKVPIMFDSKTIHNWAEGK